MAVSEIDPAMHPSQPKRFGKRASKCEGHRRVLPERPAEGPPLASPCERISSLAFQAPPFQECKGPACPSYVSHIFPTFCLSPSANVGFLTFGAARVSHMSKYLQRSLLPFQLEPITRSCLTQTGLGLGSNSKRYKIRWKSLYIMSTGCAELKGENHVWQTT